MVGAQQWAQNWVNGMNGAGERMRVGALALQTAPGVTATEADTEQKMRVNWLESLTSGRWHNATIAVSLQQWQQSYISKAIPRIADGVRVSMPKVQSYATRAIPIMTALQAQIRAMPSNNDAAMEQRALTWMRGMKAARGALRGM